MGCLAAADSPWRPTRGRKISSRQFVGIDVPAFRVSSPKVLPSVEGQLSQQCANGFFPARFYCARQRLTVRASAGRRFADSLLPLVQFIEALLGVFEERAAVPFVFYGQEYPIGIGSTETVQPLSHASLIIVNLGQVAIARHVIE